MGSNERFSQIELDQKVSGSKNIKFCWGSQGFADAMGKPLDAKLINAYAEGFRKIPVLKTRGFSLLVNTSGKLFVNSRPSLKDVDANTEVHVTKICDLCLTTYPIEFLVYRYFCQYILHRRCFGVMCEPSPVGDRSYHDHLQRQG